MTFAQALKANGFTKDQSLTQAQAARLVGWHWAKFKKHADATFGKVSSYAPIEAWKLADKVNKAEAKAARKAA